ncbi:EcsC family protein [Brevibacillus sp. SYSU BS000544]|uniref:EcsC family protein n=1 Tax=Brevibacillus sp. SYSU BS000544 TaxID=3416443 RepID=UPI003CE519C1
METINWLQDELKAIQIWENEQKDLWFWEKIGRYPFVLLDRITPTFVKEKLGQAIDELSGFIESGGRYLVNEQDVLKHFREHDVDTIRDMEQLPIRTMDATAETIIESHKKMATVQGATTGIGGIFTLLIDIPLILGISLKVLQELAIVYGYHPHEKKERIFIVKCLQFSSSDIVGKKAIIEDLARMGEEDAPNQTMSQIQGWREVLITFRDNFGWKKLFQIIPIAGMIFGAYFNRKSIEDVAEVGKMMYRKRRIIERINAAKE